MPKRFCVTGTCIPEKNYMVDISGRIDRIIRDYIEKGQYFTINRARQYGKTTTLWLIWELPLAFNKNKETGIRELQFEGKKILEVVV